MKKSTFVTSIASIVIVALSFVLFIRFTNDHKECDTVSLRKVDKNGVAHNIRQHICKERFNF